MAFECRLCGQQKPLNDLVISLQSESQSVRFIDLVQYFCRVDLDENPLLPQNVCKACQVSLENFMVFCDKMESYQFILKQRKYVKKEEITRQCMIVRDIVKIEPEPSVEESLLVEINENANVDPPDEDLDSPLSNDQTEDTRSSSGSTYHFNLRNKAAPELKNCSIVLEKLDITYEVTDSEYEDESDEGENSPLRKQSRVQSESPGKRMRLSLPANNNPKSDDNRRTTLGGPLSTQSNFKNYYKLFQNVFSLSYKESRYNLTVPSSAKMEDGTITDDYAKQFRSWNSIELKCLIKGCEKKTMSPYELMLHNQSVHNSSTDPFIKCTQCEMSTLFNFTQYVMHAINSHFGNLRYSCVICSKLHYNLTALFNHYQHTHIVFFNSSGIQMCLYDGHFFEDFTSLENHLTTHNKSAKKMKVPNLKLECNDGQTSLANGNENRELSTKKLSEKCSEVLHSSDVENHEKTHGSSEYKCKTCNKSFNSNFGLILHETSEHQDKNANVTA